MPKRILFLFVIIFLPAFLFSQQRRLMVQGTGDQLYLAHTVTSGENFYSIGRLYNVAPRNLAAFNRLSMDKGLNVGQSLRIPLNNENFSQTTTKDAAEALVPVYHQVAGGETLFRIGVNYHNVPLQQLKSWNHLATDNVNKGADMIVGFLKVNKSESVLAQHEFKAVNTPAVAVNPNPPVQAKPEVKPKETASAETPAVNRQQNTQSSPPIVVTQPAPVADNSMGGFFRTEYAELARNAKQNSVNGTAAVFKSTSGWQDGKYYCFNNDAQPGSIVQVEVPGSSKIIYAKVLDAIPDIRQNEGLTLVLSNAAADALGIIDEKFDVQVKYCQ